jgi:DHA2 family multidrug resistance protein-like MFS transporter
VIGSVYASLYASRLTNALPAGLPAGITRTAHASVGGALTLADKLVHSGHPALAAAIHEAGSGAFFHGFHAANFVSAGIAAAGAVMALALLPAHPTVSSGDASDQGPVGSPATAVAHS